jgi:hypothetical protein
LEVLPETLHSGHVFFSGCFGVHTENYRKPIIEREKAYLEQKRREFKP